MNFQAYKAYFDGIVKKEKTEQQGTPYDNPEYLDYTKLNWSRMNRWFKTGKLSKELLEAIKKIDKPQHWIVITEPWCGDAAHNIPFIEMAAKHNPLVSTSYELRDAPPFLIDRYLTKGAKSIPKLIIRDEQGRDMGTWGPRPEACQKMYGELISKNADFEQMKMEIQKWYNVNKGIDVQSELRQLITGSSI